MDLTSI